MIKDVDYGIPISFRLKTPLAEELRRRAESIGTTRHKLAREAVKRWLWYQRRKDRPPDER